MKTYAITFLGLLFSLSALANTITALTAAASPGDWATGSTWSSGTVPASGDLVIIPSGKAVEVSSQVYSSTSPFLSIEISGVLDFRPSGRLELRAGSYLQLFSGAKIVPFNSSSSQLITIGGITKYSAANNGTVTGPAYANAISGVSAAGLPLSGFGMGVLPVKLVFFGAKETTGIVELRWTTAEELNTDHFEVERSTDGATWGSVNRTSANGAASNYIATDRSGVKGSVLYRLKCVDKDGRSSYSSIVKIENNNTWGLLISPNPTKANFNITISDVQKENTSINLFNMSGRMVKKISCEAGRTNYRIETSSLSKGSYIVAVLKNEEQIANRTVIVE